MAAGDAAMQQLAQAFSALGYNAKAAANSLKNLIIPPDFSQSVKNITSALSQMRASLTPLAGAISDLIKAVANSDAFNRLKNAVLIAAAVIAGPFVIAAKSVASVAKIVAQELKAIGSAIKSRLMMSFPGLGDALKTLGTKISGVLGPLAGFVAGAAKLGAAVGGLGVLMATKVAGVSSGFGLVGKSLGLAKSTVTSMAMAPIAGFELLSGALGSVIGMIEKFVSSLNPAIVEQLQLAFDDLFAVVGRLFVPIMAAVVPIVRTFADALVPVIQSMLPAFQLFADALINIATPVIGIFSGLLQMLQPYLEEFAGMVAKIASTIGQGLLPIVEAMIPYWEALAEIVLMLMEPLNELVKALMSLAVPILNLIVPPLVAGLKLLADIVVWVVKKFAWLIGTIAGFANDLVGGGGKRLKIPQVTPGASRGMAAKGAQFTGFAEFGQQIMAASFGSSVNTPEFKTAENTAKIADGIQTLVRQGENQAPAIPIGQNARGKF